MSGHWLQPLDDHLPPATRAESSRLTAAGNALAVARALAEPDGRAGPEEVVDAALIGLAIGAGEWNAYRVVPEPLRYTLVFARCCDANPSLSPRLTEALVSALRRGLATVAEFVAEASRTACPCGATRGLGFHRDDSAVYLTCPQCGRADVVADFPTAH